MKAASVKIPTTLALSPEVRETLDTFAAQQERSRSWVAGHAIKQFVERQRTGASPGEDAFSSSNHQTPSGGSIGPPNGD